MMHPAGEGQGRRNGQADPEGHAEVDIQKGVGVGADAVKGDVAQIQHAGQPHDHVEPQAQTDVDQHIGGHVLGIPSGKEGIAKGKRQQGDDPDPVGHPAHGKAGGVPQSGKRQADGVKASAFVHQVEQQADRHADGDVEPDGEGPVEGEGAVRVNAQQGPQQSQQPQQADGVGFPDFLKLLYHRYSRP